MFTTRFEKTIKNSSVSSQTELKLMKNGLESTQKDISFYLMVFISGASSLHHAHDTLNPRKKAFNEKIFRALAWIVTRKTRKILFKIRCEKFSLKQLRLLSGMMCWTLACRNIKATIFERSLYLSY